MPDDDAQLTGDWTPIPADQYAALQRWSRISGVSVHIEGYHGGGFSGAPIALATWQAPNAEPKRGFLRFYRDDTDEIARVNRAYDQAPPEFRKAHLPGAETVSLGESWVAMVAVAGGDLLACPPLLKVMTEQGFDTHLAKIVRSLVQDWNQPPPAGARRTTTVAGYLAELVDGRPDRRADPRARLLTWAEQNGISAAQDEVRLPWWSHALPNPLAFLVGSAASSRVALSLHTGYTHGDVNIGNMLMPIDPTLDGGGYQLIDLGSYHADGPLTRDPMHLLLSLAAQWLRASTRIGDERTGTDLIRLLIRPSADRAGYRPELLGHAQISGAVHEAGRAAAASLGFGDRWRLETLLSLAGCALLFADRNLRMPDEDKVRGWFFTLAAAALDEYVRLAREHPLEAASTSASSTDAERSTTRPSQTADPGTDEAEAARQSCAAIAHHLVARARGPGLIAEQTHLLLLDFGSRATRLDQQTYSQLAGRMVRAFSPADEISDEPEEEADQELGTVREPVPVPVARATIGAGAVRSAAPETLPPGPGQGVDVAVLTSHPAEFRAVVQVFLGTGSIGASTLTERWASLSAPRAGRPLSIYLTCSPERLKPKRAAAVRDIAERFDPPALFLVGTARGRGDGRLGDVVVPKWACHYELLDSGETVTRVPRLWTPDHVRTQLSYYRRADTGFQEVASEFRKAAEPGDLPALPEDMRPEIIFDGAVACGDPRLMDDVTLDDLRRGDQRLAALDTESYEFGLWNERRLWAVFRGLVSDDAARSGSAQELFLAAGHAAACLKDFLEHEYVDVSPDQSGTARSMTGGE
ncbi:hypothetical protein [Micromonospora zamorensis]|uniref:hypothetical protein n=1 Tax=Micromonospora zamorensis TaxID=709883 RepID=UPI0033BA0975